MNYKDVLGWISLIIGLFFIVSTVSDIQLGFGLVLSMLGLFRLFPAKQ